MPQFDWDDTAFGPSPLPPADGFGFEKGFAADLPHHEPIIVGEEDRPFAFESFRHHDESQALRRASSSSSSEPASRERSASSTEGVIFDNFLFGEQVDTNTPALSNDETPFSTNIGAAELDGLHFEPLFQPSQPHAFACAFGSPTEVSAGLSAEPQPVDLPHQQQQPSVTCSPKELFADPSSPPFGVESLSPRAAPLLAAQAPVEKPLAAADQANADATTSTIAYNEAGAAVAAALPKKPAKSAATKRKRGASSSPCEDSPAFKADRYTGTRNTSVPMLDLDAPIAPRNYAAASRTSRKEVPVLIQRQLKKQKRDVPSADATEAELEPDVKAEIESKRKANTIAARRSRQRKAEHLKGLEDSLEQARAEAAAERELRLRAEQRMVQMEARLQELERMLSVR